MTAVRSASSVSTSAATSSGTPARRRAGRNSAGARAAARRPGGRGRRPGRPRDVQRALRELQQRGDAGRVEFQRVVGEPRFRCGLVVLHQARRVRARVRARRAARSPDSAGLRPSRKSTQGCSPAQRAIFGSHRHVPDLEAVQSIRPRRVAVPALRAAHARRLQLAVDFPGACVDRRVLPAPHVQVLVVAGEQVGVHEGHDRARHAVAVLALAGLRHDGTEAPAVDAAVPLAAGRRRSCRRGRRCSAGCRRWRRRARPRRRRTPAASR